jgi:VIT1/CCC1 family predicted Fe2+/Mn2+ transporter
MENTGKIPITVGIISAPDAIITPQHRSQIENLFKDLVANYPNSPVIIFSPMATNAERLAATLLLNLKEANEKYKEQFELFIPLSEDDRSDDKTDKETDTLLRKAKRKFYLSHEENKSERSTHSETLRFVADNSLILIVLWNGLDTKGGITELVTYKRFGDEKNVAKSTFEYEGSVIIIPCNSVIGQISDITITDENKSLLNSVLEDSTIRQALDKIEEINSDGLKIDQESLIRSQSGLIDDIHELPDPQKSILNIYSVLDVLSLYNHKRYNLTVICLFITGLFIIVSFGIYTNIWLNDVMLAIAILFISLAGIIYYYSRITNHHPKYIYNRTLAEALRIQFYWNIAGINKKVSDYILRIYRKEFVWIEHILSSVYGTTYNNSQITDKTVNKLAINWVKRQADFFDYSIQKMTQKIAMYQTISNISFIAAAVLLLSIFFLDKFYIRNNLMNYLQVIIGTLLGIFALIRGYIQIKGYSQLLNQYELMKILYRKAETKINNLALDSPESGSHLAYLQELFFIIGKESLIENGTWHLILKDKEPGIEGI